MLTPEVLIIEDEERQRKVLKKWIECEGYTCTEASNGIEGLERFAEFNGNIKLVILDIMMPHMDGLEFLEKIRNEAISIAPVIICTGVSPEELERLDIFAIFEKPVNHKAFLYKVHRALYFGKRRTTIMTKIRNMKQAIEGHMSEAV